MCEYELVVGSQTHRHFLSWVVAGPYRALAGAARRQAEHRADSVGEDVVEEDSVEGDLVGAEGEQEDSSLFDFAESCSTQGPPRQCLPRRSLPLVPSDHDGVFLDNVLPADEVRPPIWTGSASQSAIYR